MRILLIDDSELIRTKIIELLHDIQNLEIVDTASDGFEGVVKFWRHKPDIVLLDVKMPKLDGIQVLQNIKTNDFPITVIILTNYDNDFFREVCFENGADYFFDKATEFEKVYEICKKFAEQ